jgi:hypothetical protein
MLKTASVVLGFLFRIGGTVGCFMLAGQKPASLLYLVPALAMFLIPVGCSFIGFGLRGPLAILRSVAALWREEPAERLEATRTISACIGYVYGAGAFVFCASIVTMTASFPELAASGLTAHFGGMVAGTMVSLIYTVVLAELVLRPVKHRLTS